MVSIRSIFRRLPSVTYSRGKYHVHGSDLELWRMATAVMLALEQRGLDTTWLRGDLYDVAVESCRHTTDRDRWEDAQND